MDSDDFAVFASCRTGTEIPRADTANCRAADFDGDRDVDQSDFGTFQRCYSGADRPADPKCGL